MGGQFSALGVLLHRGYGTVAEGIRGRSFCTKMIHVFIFLVIRAIEQYLLGVTCTKGSFLVSAKALVAMPPALKKEEKEKTIKGKEGTLQRHC